MKPLKSAYLFALEPVGLSSKEHGKFFRPCFIIDGNIVKGTTSYAAIDLRAMFSLTSEEIFNLDISKDILK